MKLLPKIVNRLIVVVARSEAAGWKYALCELMFYKNRVRFKTRMADIDLGTRFGVKVKTPVALLIAGNGVISKIYPATSDAARAIISNNDEFVSATQDEGADQIRLTFMRRSQYEALVAELGPYELPLVATHLCSAADISTDAADAGKEFFDEDLKVRNIIRPTQQGNTIASFLAGKLMLPVLGVVLAALIVNFFVSNSLQKEVQQQQIAMSSLRANETERTGKVAEKQKFDQLVLPATAYKCSYLADRIAQKVPTGMALTSMAINPVAKKIESGKAVEATSNIISIKGEASTSEAVTIFAESIKTLEFAAVTKLVSVERDRNDKYMFKIEVRL